MNKGKILLTILFFVYAYLLSFFISSAIIKASPNLNLDEPVAGSYRSDEYIFLKTFYLMRQGNDYYKAFNQAVTEDARGIVLTGDAFTWRLPTVFYFWNVTAISGKEIFRNFWFLVIISVTFIYFILRKCVSPKLAILGTLLVIPYFVDIINYKTAFLFTEWWAWFFLIIGLGCYLYNNLRLAWPFFILAVLTRELMLIPICVFLIYSIYLKKDQLYFLSIIACFLVFYLFHRSFVASHLVGETSSVMNFGARFHGFDKQSFLTMISFSMKKYPLVSYRIHYVLIFVSTLSLAVSIVRKVNKEIFYVFLAGFSFLVSLPFITTSAYNDYWGILFMPTLIFSIPLAVSRK